MGALAEGEERWYVVPVNPQPWAIGPVSGGRTKGGAIIGRVAPNAKLQAYQEEFQETLKRRYPDIELIEHEVDLKFWFWRIRETSFNMKTGRKSHENEADSTNLQKGTEDALQGILIKNDRQVKACSSAIVRQHLIVGEDDSTGLVLVRISRPADHESEIPSEVWDNVSTLAEPGEAVIGSRSYIDPEDFF